MNLFFVVYNFMLNNSYSGRKMNQFLLSTPLKNACLSIANILEVLEDFMHNFRFNHVKVQMISVFFSILSHMKPVQALSSTKMKQTKNLWYNNKSFVYICCYDTVVVNHLVHHIQLVSSVYGSMHFQPILIIIYTSRWHNLHVNIVVNSLSPHYLFLTSTNKVISVKLHTKNVWI